MTSENENTVDQADGVEVTVDEVREQLLQSANRIMAEHWPGDDGRCPICRVPGCWAMSQATSYLEEVLGYRTRLPIPPLSVEILVRAAVPPPGVRLDCRLASEERLPPDFSVRRDPAE